MVRQQLTQFAFYRYRYVLAYTAFGLALAIMLLVAGFYLPGGLASSEIKSALISDGLDPTNLFQLPPDQLIYLPFRLLQAATISIFGISVLGIKLPSIILGFASALSLLYLLNLWYKQNVAIIVAIIAVTTSQFLLSSQAGQAGITYIFLTTMVLISASMIAKQSTYAKAWAIFGFIFAAISLYMPLNVYILLALVLTALIHPHARYLVFKKSSKSIIAIGSFIALIIISPLILGIAHDPSILQTLFGIPNDFGELANNTHTLVQNYTQFSTPSTGDVITPVYGLGLVALIILGFYRLFTTKYTARSYLISFWLLAIIPLVCLNPEFVSITFIPVVLIIALAVDYLISSWYKLFPRNPYARIFGLVPLGILMIGLVMLSVDRYAYGLHYDHSVYKSYSYDLPLLQKRLKSVDSNTPVYLIVTKENEPFYASFARHQSYVNKLVVRTSATSIDSTGLTIAERSFADDINKIPNEILVTRTADDANRFYLYKNDRS